MLNYIHETFLFLIVPWVIFDTALINCEKLGFALFVIFKRDKGTDENPILIFLEKIKKKTHFFFKIKCLYQTFTWNIVIDTKLVNHPNHQLDIQIRPISGLEFLFKGTVLSES